MQLININLLENNSGQIPGIKQNPRDLTKTGFDKAIQSISEFPEMLNVRTLVCVPYDNKYVVIGGNQRLRALKHLRYTEVPCIVVNWDTNKINEFIIKDNIDYGEWDFDLLANQWDVELLVDWGLELPVDFSKVEPEDTEVVEKEVKPTMYGLTIETEIKNNFNQIKKELDRLKIGYVEWEK